jgi:hypothetical protein
MRAPLLVLVFAVACGDGKGPKSPSDHVDDDGATGARPSGGNGGPSIESEIGALDEDAVKGVFKQARSKVTKCLRRANDGMDMEIVGGELEVQLRVKGDGTLRWVYPMRSTIGDRDAEQCVLDVLNSHTWPKPEGGDEGLARTDYGIDPPGRAPVDWSPSDLGAKQSKVKSELRSCMNDAGANSLSVTMYVDADGNVIKAGGSVGDENGIDAIDCGVDAVKSIKFPSPGSYPAKVTVSVN